MRKFLMMIAAFSFCLIAYRAYKIPMEYRKTLYGDGYSDINTYSAILYFKDHGFLKTFLLPVHNYTQTRDEKDIYVYTHYPALPDVLSASYAYLLQTEDERVIRIIPIILSALMSILVWVILKRLSFHTISAQVSMAFFLLSNYFISYADNLHKHIYEELFKWSFVALMILYYRGNFTNLLHYKPHQCDNRQQIYIVSALAIVVFLASHSSFEPITYIATCTIGFSLLFEKKIFTKLNIFLGLMTIFAFMSHFYQAVLYYGDFQLALEDFRSSLSHRVVGRETPRNVFTTIDFLLHPFRAINRLERMFLIPGWAFLFIAFYGLKDIYIKNKTYFKFLMVILAASYSWYIIMPQHAYVHPFTARQFGVFITLTTGHFLISYWKVVKAHFSQRKKAFIALHSLMIFYTIMMILTQHIIPVYYRFGFGFKAL